jgi:hypothetical protein
MLTTPPVHRDLNLLAMLGCVLPVYEIRTSLIQHPDPVPYTDRQYVCARF